MEIRRNERQEHELNKLFVAGSTATAALPAGQTGAGKGAGKSAKGKVERKTMPCFKMRDTGNCPDGDKCEYSHKKDIIDAAKEKKKNGGKGKGKDKKSGNGKGKAKQICRDFNTYAGQGMSAWIVLPLLARAAHHGCCSLRSGTGFGRRWTVTIQGHVRCSLFCGTNRSG